MTVTDKSFHHVERLGQTHYFCGAKCKARFVGGADERALLAVNTFAQRRLLWLLSLLLLAVLLIASGWFQSQ